MTGNQPDRSHTIADHVADPKRRRYLIHSWVRVDSQRRWVVYEWKIGGRGMPGYYVVNPFFSTWREAIVFASSGGVVTIAGCA